MLRASKSMALDKTGEEGEGHIIQDLIGHIFWFAF